VWYQLYDKLQEYVTEHERDELSAKLQQTEDWLYEDGEDETKSVYVAKLGELKKVIIWSVDDAYGIESVFENPCSLNWLLLLYILL
jgi:hypothetical protein